MSTGSVGDFMTRHASGGRESTASSPSSNTTLGASNTALGASIAADLRAAAAKAARRAPRSTQVHLGPSEIGEPCHRQVAGKLAGLPSTNNISDPWPAIVGTAVHAWLADALAADDPTRWLVEQRVTPAFGHSGTADLYDAQHRAVIDHKVLGQATGDALVRQGPKRQYFVQLLLYAWGYRTLGIPVERVAISCWRRQGRLTDLYVWEHPLTSEDAELVAHVLGAELTERKEWAAAIRAGRSLRDVPAHPGDGCYFCPFYRLTGGDPRTTCAGA